MSLRVLITGAGGYIGSNAAEFFLGQGCEVTGMIRNKWTRCLGYHFVMDTDQSSVFPLPRILNWRDARQRLGEVIPVETCQGVAYCLYLEEPDDEGAWRAICNHILTFYATEMSKLTKKATDVSVYMDEVISSLHVGDEEMATHQENNTEDPNPAPDPEPEPEPETTP